MINFFLKSTELDVRTIVNQILYYFRKIPLLKYLAPGSSFRMSGIKKIVTFFSPLGVVLFSFGKSLLVYGIFALVAFGIYSFGFINIEFNKAFLKVYVPWIILDFSRFILGDKKDRVLVHFNLFNVDPKVIIISDLVFKEILNSLGKFFALTLVGLIVGIHPRVAFLIICTEYFTNLIANYINFKLFEKKIINTESTLKQSTFALFFIMIVVVLLFIFNIELGNYLSIISILSAVLGIIGLILLFKYNKFTETLLAFNENYTGFSQKSAKEKQLEKATVLNKEDLEKSKAHLKKDLAGYDLLNELFFQRHRRILLKPILIKASIAAFILAVLVLLPILPIDRIPEPEFNYGETVIRFLPGILPFAAYFIFFQESLTRTMFVNCDQALMQYGFYRRPKDLLKMFGIRLKKLLLWNSLSLIISIIAFLAIGLIYSPNILDVFIVILQIIALWVFFSVHTLFIYYIFQPYNDEHELKHPIYQVINFVVYFICYSSMNARLSGPKVAPIFIGASVIYSIIALVLVYKKAPDTFKVRISK